MMVLTMRVWMKVKMRTVTMREPCVNVSVA